MSKEKNKSLKKQAVIDTLWFMPNYGSVVSAFALAKMVEANSYDALLLNKPFQFWRDKNTSPDGAAGSFIFKNCNVSPVLYSSESFMKLEKDSEVYILGSDDVWSYELCGKDANFHYYFESVSDNKKKISYASGFGGDYTGPYGEEKKLCIEYLKRFDGISVGDYKDAEVMGQNLGIEPKVVLNPILMCDKSVFEKAAENSDAKKVETADSFVFSYIRNGDPRKKQLVLRGNEIIAEKSSSPMRNIVDLGNWDRSRVKLGMECTSNNKIEDWIYYITKSEFVITDDVSAVSLAVLFNKPFVFVGSENAPSTIRAYAMLNSLGIDERIIFTEDDFRVREYLFRMPIRYNKVNKLLDEQREMSAEWLKSYLV